MADASSDRPVPVTVAVELWTTGRAARYLGMYQEDVYRLVRDGTIPATRSATSNRYLISTADLETFAAARAGIRTLRDAAGLNARISELERQLAEVEGRKLYDALDSLTLEELLDYLRNFRTDDRAEHRAKYETERGLQRVLDGQHRQGVLGKRPKGTPRHAKHRPLSTGIGQIDIWYWQKANGMWAATYGGPRPRWPGRQSGTNRPAEAIKLAGIMARQEYGKPVRRSSTRLRFIVLERDGFACHYCGRRPPDVALHVDHVIPVARGGTDDLENLAAACWECNQGKADNELIGLDTGRACP